MGAAAGSGAGGSGAGASVAGVTAMGGGTGVLAVAVVVASDMMVELPQSSDGIR